MKKKHLLDSSSEDRTDRILRTALAGTGFRLFSRQKLGDVLQRDVGEAVSRHDRNFLETSHLDFVVGNPDCLPEFAVEFDGPVHDLDPNQRERDIRKNRLCHMGKLPLWRIGDTELEEYDKFTILEFIIMRFLAWREESENIKHRIAEYIATLDETQKRALVSDGVADPVVDPTFHFDIAHPFPRTREVAKRLLEQHKVVSLLAQPFLSSSLHREPYRLFCDVFAPSLETFDRHDLVVRCDYIVSRSQEPFFGTKTIASQADRKSSEILKRGSLNFRIRASLPIVPDYDPNEAPIEYFMRKGEMPVSFPELPGVTPHDIGETMSEYLGLREVEKWARED